MSPDLASVVLCLVGEIDVASAPALREAGIDQLRTGRRLTVDLAQVTFLDAYGVSTLVSLRSAAEAAGLELRIVNATARCVRRVLSLTRADEVLTIE